MDCKKDYSSRLILANARVSPSDDDMWTSEITATQDLQRSGRRIKLLLSAADVSVGINRERQSWISTRCFLCDVTK